MTESTALRQETDTIDARRLVLVLSLSLLFGAAALVGAWLLLRSAGAAPAPHSATGPAFSARAPEHRSFNGHERGVALRAEQLESLNHYSRVDPDAGVVSIPIGRAIELELGVSR